MRINDISSSHFNLADVAKIASTIEFRCKVNEALKILECFFKMCKKPAVSWGGGKDGTAVLILAQMIDPNVRVLCANPPNPLPGRGEHIKMAVDSCGIKIITAEYSWDVDAVLAGNEKYPEKLKMKVLAATQKEHQIDGIIWGCRNSESRGRTLNFIQNGYIYKVSDGTYRCQPIAKWTPEDALALAAVSGYPINPVYEKMDGFYNLNELHDGTWWPHDANGTKGSWIKRYFPECYEQYIAAEKIYTNKTFQSCSW